MNSFIALAASFWLAAQMSGDPGVISGIVLNGTESREPVAGAEVVLRAGNDGSFSTISQTTTDRNGCFLFDGLPTDSSIIYLPGANWHDVHYPGPRVRLDVNQATARVELIAYDAVAAPSPLVARGHEISIRVDTGSLEVSETLKIENPSRLAYVGEGQDDRPAVTLRLSIPTGFETVTFDQEFYGRSFLVHDGTLVTDLPWPPGVRALTFRYRLPVDQGTSCFCRTLDLPTEQVTVRVANTNPTSIVCNLPTGTASQTGEVAFHHQGPSLPSGHEINLQLGSLPVRWESRSRWVAVAALTLLVAGSILWNRRHRGAVSSLSLTPQIPENARRGRKSLSPARKL